MAAVQVSRESCIPLATAPGFALRADAAAAWDRAVTKLGKRLLLTGAWRSYETQERLFRDRYVKGNHAGSAAFTDDVRYWQGSPWTRRKGTAAAAVPGTSNHGGGLAVDVKTSRDNDDPGRETSVIFTGWTDPDRVRFLSIAAAHGWDDDEGRAVNEVWHLTYYPTRDRHRGERAPATNTEDETMPRLTDAVPLTGAARSALGDHQTLAYQSLVGYSAAGGFQAMQRLPRIEATLAAQAAAIEALAKSAGADPDAIAKSVTDAIERRLADFEVTLRASED